jgi:O-antigen/teichoic acid export membrane protein
MLKTEPAGLKDYGLSVIEGVVGLCTSLGVMIVVERVSGESGLGIFAYLLSLFYVASLISSFGVPELVEREAALDETDGDRSTLPTDLADAARATLVSSFLCSAFFVLSAVYDTGYTRIEERAAAYLIIGLTIPLRNFNELKLACLQGRGNHALAANLKIARRIVFVVAIFLMLAVNTSPSYLVLGFSASELMLMFIAWRKVRLRLVQALWRRWRVVARTLRRGFDYLFYDETLEAVFYIDFLVLGLFVSSSTLGVYAEASVLARFFILIPTSIKPIIRRRYCRLASGNDASSRSNDAPPLSMAIRKSAAVMLFVQFVFGLYFLLYYTEILNRLFDFHGEELVSFQVFTLLLPGLLFFSAFTLQEPVYEACGRLDLLQKLVLTASGVNLALNLYLVPFAGPHGAAFATTGSMLTYFLIFGRGLGQTCSIRKTNFILAAGISYLTYELFHWLDLSFAVSIWFVPAALFALLTLVGFFDFEDRPQPQQRRS